MGRASSATTSGRVRVTIASALTCVLALEAPLRVAPVMASTMANPVREAPGSPQQGIVKPEPPPPPSLVGAQPLPPETIRKADLSLEDELKREAALIGGERIGTDGAPVSQTVVLGLVFTRDLWVALLRKRADDLAALKAMSREDKLALLEQLLQAAPAVRDAYLNMIAAEGPALNPYKHEKAYYDGQVRDADNYDKTASAATDPAVRDRAIQAAAEARDRAERSPWKFYLDRRALFFGLLEQDPINGLLGLYYDPWLGKNLYLFQMLMQTAYSLDSKERADQLITHLDNAADANITRLRELADEAEAIDDFEDLLEFANPKYASIHELGAAISKATGMTAPALFMLPLADVGKSYELTEVFGDILKDMIISIISVGSMVIPVVGAIVNTGIAIVEVVNEGGRLVIQFSTATDARQTAAVTGQSYVISEDDKTRARAGRLIFAVVQVGGTAPFVRGVVREARVIQVARAREARRFGIDLPLADQAAVQRGAAKALALGVRKEMVDGVLALARSKTLDEIRAALIKAGTPLDALEEAIEREFVREVSRASPAAGALMEIGRLDELMAAARAAGVKNVDELYQAALKTGTVLSLGQDLPMNLLREMMKSKGITVVLDGAYGGYIKAAGRSDWFADVPMERYLAFWRGALPGDPIRTDLIALLTLRGKLQDMRNGLLVRWSQGELSSLQKVMQHPNLSRLHEFVSDEGVFLRLFDDDMIDFGRRFLQAPNFRAIAEGRVLLNPGGLPPRLAPPVATGAAPAAAGAASVAPSADPFARWVVTGEAASQVLERFPRQGLKSLTLESGLDPFSPEAMTGVMSTRPTGDGAVAGGTAPSEYQLADAAINRARSRFGTAVANWTTVVLPDGSVAVTSPDRTKRVTASTATRSTGERRIDFKIESIRDRFLDHESYSEVNLTVALPTSDTTVPALEGPTRPVGSAPPASPPPSSPGASAPRETSAGPATPPPFGAKPIYEGTRLRDSNGLGIPVFVSAANSWMSLRRPTETLTASGPAGLDVAPLAEIYMRSPGTTWDVKSRSARNTDAVNSASAEPRVQSILGFVDNAPVMARALPSRAAPVARLSERPSSTTVSAHAFSLFGFTRPSALPRRSGAVAALQSPQGSAAANETPALKVFFSSLGETSGEAFRMTIVNESGAPIAVSGESFVLEPLARMRQSDIDREIQRLKGNTQARTVTALGYCLEFAKQGPPAGMIFRVASRPVQEKFASARSVPGASKALFDAGKLAGGKNDAYLHAVRQWSIWTLEQKFDESAFDRAFVEHSKQNIAAARRQWTPELERAVRQAIPLRWQDIRQVLDLAAQQRATP